MSGRWKLLIILGLLLGLISLQIFISKGQLNNSNDSPPSLTPVKNQVVQYLSGVHIVENSGTKQIWELWASKGALDNQNTWRVSEIKVNFLSDNGMVYEVTAPEGFIESNKNNDIIKLKLLKNVVTKSSSGYAFYSKEAEYLKNEHELVFPGIIRMTGPVKNYRDIELTGKNMNIYLTTNEIKINQDIFVIHKGSSETVTLKSNSAVLNGQTKIANFMGHVNVEMTEYNIKSEVASFNFNKKE